MRLRWHLMLLIALAALPVLGLQVFHEYRQRETRRDALADEVAAHTRAVAGQLDELFQLAGDVLMTVAQLPSVRARNPEACGAVLASIRPVAGARIFAVSAEGRPLCVTGPEQTALDISGRPYFQRALRDRKVTVGDYLSGRLSGDGLIPIAHTVLDDSGAVTAVLVLGVTAERLSAALGKLELPPGGVLGLMQRDGTLVARAPAVPDRVGRLVPDADFRAAAAAIRPGAYKTGLDDGEERFVGLAPLAAAPNLIAYYGLPAATVFAEADSLYARELALIAAVFLLAALAALAGGELLVGRPIASLREKVHRLAAERDATSLAPIGASLSELRDLDQSLQAAACLLRQRERELRSRTAELETVMETVPAIIWLAHDPAATRISGSRYGAERLRLAPAANQSKTAPEDERPAHFRVLRDGVELAPAELPVQRAARGEEVRGEELQVLFDDGSSFWELVNAAPVRDTGGRVTGAVGAAIDITERKRAEAERERLLESQRLLMAELDHRVKNTLATVQAVVWQSLGHTAEAEALSGRLAALAKAHSLLSQSRWQGAHLRALLKEELRPYRKGPDGERVRLQGPNIVLRPKAAQALGLVLHELATNAAKYGALSVPGGRLDVTWRIEAADGSSPGLRLVWREANGPPVETSPRRRGFGMHLIERSLAYEMQGDARLDFRPEGLTCRIELPLDAAVATAAAEETPAAAAAPPDDAAEPAARQALAGKRVLVVEDALLVAAEIEALVRGAGGEVVGPIGRLDEALARAADEPLDGAVLDVNLDGEMVFPLAELLRRRDVPFIFVTGYERPAVLPASLQGELCLAKPFEARELLTALARAVSRRREGAGDAPRRLATRAADGRLAAS